MLKVAAVEAEAAVEADAEAEAEATQMTRICQNKELRCFKKRSKVMSLLLFPAPCHFTDDYLTDSYY